MDTGYKNYRGLAIQDPQGLRLSKCAEHISLETPPFEYVDYNRKWASSTTRLNYQGEIVIPTDEELLQRIEEAANPTRPSLDQLLAGL
jgi:hypothetical protein